MNVFKILYDIVQVFNVCTYDVRVTSKDYMSPTIVLMRSLFGNSGQQVLILFINAADVPFNRIYSLVISLQNTAGSTITQQLHLSE